MGKIGKFLGIIVTALLLTFFGAPAFAQHRGGGAPRGNGGGPHGTVHNGGERRGGEQGRGPAHVRRDPGRGDGRYRGDGRPGFFDPHDRDHFGRDHHARFGYRDGWYRHGHREFFFGGYWFYPYGFSVWPQWFYNCDTYFDLGPDGNWYAYCYDNPNLSIQVYID